MTDAPEREVAVARADREHVPSGRAIGPPAAFVRVLIAAVALLAAAAAGPVAHFSPAGPDRPAHFTVGTHLGHGPLGAAVLTPASGHTAHPPGSGAVPGPAPDLLLTAALLASLLLTLVRVPPVPSHPARALPPRRGPPRLACTD